MKSFIWRGPATMVDIRADDIVIDQMVVPGQSIDLPEDHPLVAAWLSTLTIEPAAVPSAAPSRARRRPGDAAPSDPSASDVTVDATPKEG